MTLATLPHLTPGQSAKYRKARADGMSAKNAKRYATWHPEPFPWEENRRSGDTVKSCTVERDGFRIRLEVVRDDDNSSTSDYLGKFSDSWTADAVKMRENTRANEYQYFIPAITYREHYKGLRELKYGRAQADQMAREYVHRDMERLRELGETWGFLGVQATVYLNSVELAESAVWGIEDDSDDEYVDETAAEQMAEAISEAKRRLVELRKSPGAPAVLNAGNMTAEDALAIVDRVGDAAAKGQVDTLDLVQDMGHLHGYLLGITRNAAR